MPEPIATKTRPHSPETNDLDPVGLKSVPYFSPLRFFSFLLHSHSLLNTQVVSGDDDNNDNRVSSGRNHGDRHQNQWTNEVVFSFPSFCFLVAVTVLFYSNLI